MIAFGRRIIAKSKDKLRKLKKIIIFLSMYENYLY